MHTKKLRKFLVFRLIHLVPAETAAFFSKYIDVSHA
jgi:hypothetical protein